MIESLVLKLTTQYSCSYSDLPIHELEVIWQMIDEEKQKEIKGVNQINNFHLFC